MTTEPEYVPRREFDQAVAAVREQMASITQSIVDRDEIHRQAHDREHRMAESGLTKSEIACQSRQEKHERASEQQLAEMRRRLNKLEDWHQAIRGREATIMVVPIIVSIIAALLAIASRF